MSAGSPVLRFHPLAWMKLQALCHFGDTEVGGFGLVSEKDHLYVLDVVVPEQETSAVTVSFDPASVADIVADMDDRKIPPLRFERIWIHTHPGSSPSPSGVDEKTFEESFGGRSYAIMFILAKGGQTYARLRVNAIAGQPAIEQQIPVVIDWPAVRDVRSDQFRIDAWFAEYQAKVKPRAASWHSVEIDVLPGFVVPADRDKERDRDNVFRRAAAKLLDESTDDTFEPLTDSPKEGELCYELQYAARDLEAAQAAFDEALTDLQEFRHGLVRADGRRG